MYATPLDANTDWSDSQPSDWVSVFDYSKWRELEEENVISDASPGLFWALTHAVDDAALDGYDWDDGDEVGKDAWYSEEGINGVVSDSFGRSLEEYVKNPEEGNYTREDFETTARTVFTALEAENFGGEIALTGDLSNPELYKAEKETIEEIKAERNYSSQNIQRKIAA